MSSLLMRKSRPAPKYTELLMETAEKILDSGYIISGQPKLSFADQPPFSLVLWGRLGFQVPPVIEKQNVFGKGPDSVQELRLKFVYHEDNALGFASLPVISLKLYRGLPVDMTTVPSPELEVKGSKWTLLEIKYLDSPVGKKLICISW